MNKVLLVTFFFVSLSVAIPPYASAQAKVTPGCQPIYGGGQTCLQSEDFSVNLQIKHPGTGGYVDNLTTADPTFAPAQQINYKITVTNNVTRDLSNINMTIVFPQLVEYVSGTGKFDAKTRKLTFPIETLKSKESKVFFVTGKTAPKEKFSRSITCTFTQAIGTFEKKTSQDNGQFCVSLNKTTVAGATAQPNTTKGGLAVYPPSQTKTTPQTGPEVLALIGLLPAGAVGFWLRRKASH